MNDSVAIKFSKNQITGIAKNLTLLLKNNKLTENQLAQALKLPLMTIRRLASGETIDPHISTLKQIANYFDVSIDFLIETSSFHTTIHHRINKPIFVPILDWQTASEMKSICDVDLASWKSWQPVALATQEPLSEKVFALESKPSMAPRFPIGTLFVIDPNAKPMDGDLVLIKMKNETVLSIREISIDPPKWQLKPTISGSETIFYSPEEHIIVGPILLTLLYSRR